jgi:hypothetical protein
VAQTFSIEFADLPGCATREVLEGQVLARARRARVVASSGAFHFAVRIAPPSDGNVAATLITVAPEARSSTRSIDGETCQEVVSALALIMALTLDPSARSTSNETPLETAPDVVAEGETSPSRPSEANPTREIAGTPSPPTPSVTESSSGSNEKRKSKTPLEAEDRASLRAPSSARIETSALESQRISIAVGAQADWTSVLGPGFGLLSPGVHGTFALPSGPIATLALAALPEARRTGEHGIEAQLSYYGATIDVGLPVFTRQSFVLDVLSFVSVGRLHATGVASERVAVSREATATWLGLGPGAALRHRLGWGGWALQAAVPIGLSRPDFVLVKDGSDSGRFHRVSAFGVRLTLRVFLRCFG